MAFYATLGDLSVHVQPNSHCSFILELTVLCSWTASLQNTQASLWGAVGAARALGNTGLCLWWRLEV